jgi:hypothetical protein
MWREVAAFSLIFTTALAQGAVRLLPPTCLYRILGFSAKIIVLS